MQSKDELQFATIESSLEFVHLLRNAIVDTVEAVDQDLREAQQVNDARRTQGLQLVQYKLKHLSVYMHKSEKLLKDLSRLRRVLLSDARQAAEHTCATACRRDLP